MCYFSSEKALTPKTVSCFLVGSSGKCHISDFFESSVVEKHGNHRCVHQLLASVTHYLEIFENVASVAENHEIFEDFSRTPSSEHAFLISSLSCVLSFFFLWTLETDKNTVENLYWCGSLCPAHVLFWSGIMAMMAVGQCAHVQLLNYSQDHTQV